MATELKMELRKRSDGVLRAIITSVDKPIKTMCRDRREYYERMRGYLLKAGEFREIWVEINSTGGALDSAIGITAALCQRPEPMRILIDGRCDSAATLLLELPAPCYITEKSGMYIHSPCRQRYQRQNDGEYKLVKTDKLSLKIAMSYLSSSYRIRAKQCKKKIKRKTIKGWMLNGARFSAAEVVEIGLANKIISRSDFEKGEI